VVLPLLWLVERGVGWLRSFFESFLGFCCCGIFCAGCWTVFTDGVLVFWLGGALVVGFSLVFLCRNGLCLGFVRDAVVLRFVGDCGWFVGRCCGVFVVLWFGG